MKMRKMVVAVLLLIAGTNSVEIAAPRADVLDDGAVEQLAVEQFLQADAGGGKVKKVVVNVAKKARTPEPTVKALTPKHKEIQKEKWKKKHKGKVMSRAARKEITRVAKVAAAKEINQARKNKASLKKTRRQEKELIHVVKRNRKVADRVDRNREYTSLQNRRKQKRVVAAKTKKLDRRVNKEEKAAAKSRKATFVADKAEEAFKKAKKAAVAAKDKLLLAQRQDEENQDAVTKAGVILAKHRAEIERQSEAVHRSKHILEHIEDHEEAAHLEVREAKIKVNFEESDARKVKHLLKKLVAKKLAVDKFTKTLSLKSKRDFSAAKQGILKAKGDYAAAKSKMDKFTKKAAKFEAKLTKTKALIKEANEGVVLGLSMGKDAKAIKSAENHSYLRKVEAKTAKKVDTADLHAKGQHKLMGASMKELEKSEALDTVARKEGDRVKQNRETMKSQVKKIEFFKSEVAAHMAAAEKAKRRAANALHRAKTMRTNAETTVKKGSARLHWLHNVVVPFAIRAQKKAKNARRKSKQKVKEAKDTLRDALTLRRRLGLAAQKVVNVKKAVKEKLHKKVMLMKSAKKQRNEAKDAQKKLIFNLNKRLAKDKKLDVKLQKMKVKKKKKVQKKKGKTQKGKKKKKKKKGKKLAESKELEAAGDAAFANEFGFKASP